MYPLKDWKKLKRGYKFRQKTTYSSHHLGLDLIASKGTVIYSPFKGKTTKLVGKEGGNTVWFYYKDYIMRFMHLSEFGKIGSVNEGDIIGFVGSTGSLSTGPHLHLDISKNKVNIKDINNFVDPETFSWVKEEPKEEPKETVATQKEPVVETTPEPQNEPESNEIPVEIHPPVIKEEEARNIGFYVNKFIDWLINKLGI